MSTQTTPTQTTPVAEADAALAAVAAERDEALAEIAKLSEAQAALAAEAPAVRKTLYVEDGEKGQAPRVVFLSDSGLPAMTATSYSASVPTEVWEEWGCPTQVRVTVDPA